MIPVIPLMALGFALYGAGRAFSGAADLVEAVRREDEPKDAVTILPPGVPRQDALSESRSRPEQLPTLWPDDHYFGFEDRHMSSIEERLAAIEAREAEAREAPLAAIEARLGRDPTD